MSVLWWMGVAARVPGRVGRWVWRQLTEPLTEEERRHFFER